MRLILIRHGETACNVADIWHGWDDCELTAVGIAQAESLAARLAAENIACVHCSDSKRAIQTAQAVAKPHGLTPIPDARFRERFAGEFEGLSVEEVVRMRPRVWEERASDYWGWSPTGGETFRQLLSRTLTGLEALKNSYPEDTIALVGHMGTVRTLMSHLADVPMKKTYEMDFPSTGVSIFRFDDGRVHVEALNDIAHIR